MSTITQNLYYIDLQVTIPKTYSLENSEGILMEAVKKHYGLEKSEYSMERNDTGETDYGFILYLGSYDSDECLDAYEAKIHPWRPATMTAPEEGGYTDALQNIDYFVKRFSSLLPADWVFEVKDYCLEDLDGVIERLCG